MNKKLEARIEELENAWKNSCDTYDAVNAFYKEWSKLLPLIMEENKKLRTEMDVLKRALGMRISRSGVYLKDDFYPRFELTPEEAEVLKS